MKLAFYHRRGKNEWFTKANVPLSPAAIDRVLQIAYHCAGLEVLTTCSHLRQEAIRLPFCVTRRANAPLRCWHAQEGDRLAAPLADRAANVHPFSVFPHEDFVAVLIPWTGIGGPVSRSFPLFVHVFNLAVAGPIVESKDNSLKTPQRGY
jgi:hypothetical protein